MQGPSLWDEDYTSASALMKPEVIGSAWRDLQLCLQTYLRPLMSFPSAIARLDYVVLFLTRPSNNAAAVCSQLIKEKLNSFEYCVLMNFVNHLAVQVGRTCCAFTGLLITVALMNIH